MFPLTTKAGGQLLASPDVCKVPSPAGPVPTPLVNIAMPAQANNATCPPTVKIMNMPALTTQSQIPMSSGDEAGSAGGVVSGQIKGPAQATVGSTKVFLAGVPAVRLTSATIQNGSAANCTGAVIAPSQAKVLVP